MVNTDRVALFLAGFALLATAQPDPFKSSGKQAPVTSIDKPLLQQYSKLSIRPAATCPDNVFVRRVYLDTTGAIPTADQAR